MATFLFSQGADVNATNPYGMTPLHIAVIMRRLEMARLLQICINSFGPETKGFHYKAEQELIREATRRGWLMQKF